MALDLADLVEDAKSELNAPGADNYPSATDDEWVRQLRNAFWETKIDGLIHNYTESDGIITPQKGTTDLSRDLQQLIIYYVGVRVVKARLLELRTSFKTAAGPVKFEYEQSAGVMKELLAELVRRRNIWLTRLSDLGTVDSYYIDGVMARDEATRWGDTWWVGGSVSGSYNGWY
jgi:hypothetical protein